MAGDIDRTVVDAVAAYGEAIADIQRAADAMRVDDDTQRLLGTDAPVPLISPVELSEDG